MIRNTRWWKHRCSSILIFAKTKIGVDKLVKKLKASSIKASALHGGMRQNKRAHLESIINCNFSKKTIAKKIFKFSKKKIRFKKSKYFGKGNSFKNFINILSKKKIWETNIQKYFKDLKIN